MHFIVLYPQNGYRIVTIESVTSLHPMYNIRGETDKKARRHQWRG